MKTRHLVTFSIIVFMLVAIVQTSFAVDNNTVFKITNANGTEVSLTASSVSDPGSGQCWAYANNLYYKVWNQKFDSTFKGTQTKGYNLLRSMSDSERVLNATNLRNFISVTPPGAVIRIGQCTSSCSQWGNDGLSCGHKGHSLLIVQITSTGFTTMDRWDGRRTKEWTWDSFTSSFKNNYPYIKYIKWPGAKDYKQAEPSASGTYSFIQDAEARFDPYAQSAIVKRYTSGDTIEITASVLNEAGNTWYKLTDGSYVYSGYVQLTTTFRIFR